MKKIVPFKKEVELEKSISQITSISLEHTLKLKEENLISGSFIISGTYKLTDASVNTDPFEYQLPFDISIDKKYDTQNINLDINDFYYELINGKTLSISIEVVIDNLEEYQIVETKKEDTVIEEKEEERESPSLFQNLDENERYAIYKIHIITENDTIESIINTYETNKEDLEAYNDLNDLKIGDKLIIPNYEN